MVQVSQALLTLVLGSPNVSRVWSKWIGRGTPEIRRLPSIGMVILMLLATACGPVKIDLRDWGQASIAEAETSTYVVQDGDTLSGIASAHGTTVETLIQMNAATYPKLAESQGSVIVTGWALTVPASQATEGSTLIFTPPTPAAASTSSAVAQDGYFDDEAALEIVRLTNEERARNGVAPLSMDEGLIGLARQRSLGLVVDFSHIGFLASGCAGCGENIAGWYSRQSAAGFMDQWIHSPAHHENMLHESYASVGVGVYRIGSKDLAFAVQIFK